MVYGYARCSLSEEKGGQDIKRQTKELNAAGAELVIEEREHGDQEKKKLTELLNAMTPGQDSLIVCEVSRLARSTRMLCEIIEIVKNKKLRLVILGSVTVDCRNGAMDPMSRAFLQMAGIFSELELSMIRDRVRSGMANAKSKGKQIGRSKLTVDKIPITFYRYYNQLCNKTLNVTQVAKLCDLSRPTVYKYKRMLEQEIIKQEQK